MRLYWLEVAPNLPSLSQHDLWFQNVLCWHWSNPSQRCLIHPDWSIFYKSSNLAFGKQAKEGTQMPRIAACKRDTWCVDCCVVAFADSLTTNQLLAPPYSSFYSFLSSNNQPWCHVTPKPTDPMLQIFMTFVQERLISLNCFHKQGGLQALPWKRTHR
jgi:hypothetical protein